MRTWFRHFFIPHEGNDFRPDFLERFSVGVMLVLVLLSFAAANIQALVWISSDWLVSSVLPSVIVELTNEEREDNAIESLTHSAVLDRAAQLKAEDMAKNSYFAHYSPTGISPWYWFDKAGYDYLHAGENLAVHFTESDEVVKAWMRSPLHRDNIMNGKYAEIGVGTARGEYNGFPTIFVVQLFGTQRQSVAEASAGATDIIVEKLALPQASSDVAPATVETRAPMDEVAESPVVAETLEGNTPKPAETIVMSVDLATTSREGVPAMTETTVPSDTELTLPLRSAVTPSLWLGLVYAVLALSVIGSLVASMIIEWRRHHPVQIAYASGLLTVMALLLYIHLSLTDSVIIM
jgi:hypothetical protein